jgi:hypothetical protein
LYFIEQLANLSPSFCRFTFYCAVLRVEGKGIGNNNILVPRNQISRMQYSTVSTGTVPVLLVPGTVRTVPGTVPVCTRYRYLVQYYHTGTVPMEYSTRTVQYSVLYRTP